jgi:hypothetical protein
VSACPVITNGIMSTSRIVFDLGGFKVIVSFVRRQPSPAVALPFESPFSLVITKTLTSSAPSPAIRGFASIRRDSAQTILNRLNHVLTTEG